MRVRVQVRSARAPYPVLERHLTSPARLCLVLSPVLLLVRTYLQRALHIFPTTLGPGKCFEAHKAPSRWLSNSPEEVNLTRLSGNFSRLRRFPLFISIFPA